jgi:hypothetical protein
MLGLSNRRLAEYWLTQWDDDRLPQWSRFGTAPIADLLPGCALIEVQGRVLHCASWGEALVRSTGMDMTGKDWLGETPEAGRAERLARYTAVANGSVGHAMRYAQHRSGAVHYVEEIMLPFAPRSAGARPVLVHVAWRPTDPNSTEPEIRNARAIADEFSQIALGR